MATTVFFHCAQPVLDENGDLVVKPNGKIQKSTPTHTLAFEKFGKNGIILGWAKAHSCDNYSKEMGRNLAFERIEQVRNRLENFPDRKIMEIESIDDSLLPSAVLNDSFDYFFERAVSKLIDLDDTETITMFFRTTREENTVCAIELDAEEIKNDINMSIAEKIEDEKDELVTAEDANTFIFATYHDDEDLRIVIQKRETFYASGLDLKSTEEIVDTFDEIFAEKGFSVIEEDETIFASSLSELSVIRIMKSIGLDYDRNLELEFVSE